MRRRKPVPVYLSDAVMTDIWRANREALRRGTDGTVLLLGRRTQRRFTVHLVITEADTPKARQAKERAARNDGLVVVGQSRVVTEHFLRTTRTAIENKRSRVFTTPPVGHLFLVRHRLGPHVTVTAASFDGAAARQHPVRLLRKP